MPFRIEPALPVTAVKTYGMRSRLRPATCAEVQCENYAHGFRVVVPSDSAQAAYIRSPICGRGFTEQRKEAGLSEFTFAPGSECFPPPSGPAHTVAAEGGERFWEHGGDWRGATSTVTGHSPQGWQDALGEHQERLRERLERG